MQNHPNVSIYIITYLNTPERGEVLKKTCEWVLQQNYPNFEVVVSDNGGSYSAADALASIQDVRLKVCINQENVGFTGNLNRCLQHCSYDIIKPLCDDDLIHPDFLTATVPLLDDDTLVIVDVEKFIWGEEPAELDEHLGFPVSWETRNPGYGHDLWNLSYTACCIPSATLFTRSFFKELGGYDQKPILSDWDFFIEACLYAKVIHVQETLCFVGVWGGSITEMMMGDPYYYPRGSLYTQFRVLHCKSLTPNQRTRILLMVFKELIWQGLRPIKHPLSKTYWAGFFEYARCLFKLMVQKRQEFSKRPNNP